MLYKKGVQPFIACLQFGLPPSGLLHNKRPNKLTPLSVNFRVCLFSCSECFGGIQIEENKSREAQYPKKCLNGKRAELF